jgi:hypothetical protein
MARTFHRPGLLGHNSGQGRQWRVNRSRLYEQKGCRAHALAPDFYDLATQFERAISGLEKPLRTTFEHLLLSYDKLNAQIKER